MSDSYHTFPSISTALAKNFLVSKQFTLSPEYMSARR